MILNYKEQDIKIKVIYSPYHELISSLHVLHHPEHHKNRYTWAKEMSEQMSMSMSKKVYEIGKISDGFMGLYAGGNRIENGNHSVQSVLDALRQLDIYDFGHMVANGRDINHELKEIIYSYDFRERCICFLSDFYEKHLYEEISYSQPILMRQARLAGDRIEEDGIYSYIHSLHPRIEVTEDKINFHKYNLFEIYKKDLEEVNLIVDSFVMPHLLLDMSKRQVVLTIPVHITSYDKDYMPKDTLVLFKSLGDSTRLKIIKYLYKEPQSTRTLAEKLSVSEACISKHLKLLFKAKVVSKERDGNYINYYLNQQIIDGLVMHLYEFLHDSE